MTRSDALNRLQDLIRDVLDEDEVTLTDATTADEVEGWDSLAHVRIMIAVERQFGIRFEVEELSGFANVGALVDSILAKTGG